MERGENETAQIVVDDLLSFLAFKRKEWTEKELFNSVSNFYSKEVGFSSLNFLLASLPEKRKYLKIKNGQKPDDPFQAILDTFNQISMEDMPLLVCKSLNNVPVLSKEKRKHSSKSFVKRSATFIREHQFIKNQISEVFQSLCQLKENVEMISAAKAQERKKDPADDQSDYGDEDESDEDYTSTDDTEMEVEDAFNDLPYMEDYESLLEDQIIDKTADLFPKIKMETNIENDVENQQLPPELQPLASHDDAMNSDEEQLMMSGLHFYQVKHVFDDNIGYFCVYICSNCQYYSNDEDIIRKHECMTHEETSSQKNSIYSQLSFDSKRKVDSSDEFSVPKERPRQKISGVYLIPHKCPMCSEKFEVEDWMTHVRQCPGDGVKTKEHVYCDDCDVFYADSVLLKYHRSFHDETKPFECLQCKFRFSTQFEVNKHFSRHMPDRVSSTKCPFCPFPISKTCSLMDHIRNHTGEKPFQCTICGTYYRSKAKLKTHYNVHNSKSHICSVCQRGFKTENSLKHHMHGHTANRPFLCNICHKTFKLEKALTKHFQRHLQNFICPHCGFKAKSADRLEEHINNHIKCFLCDFSTCYKNTYRKHMRLKHEQDLLSH